MSSKPRPSVFPAWNSCACYEGNGNTTDAAERGTLQHKHLSLMLKGSERTQLAILEPEEAESVLWAEKYIRDWCEHIHEPIETDVELPYYLDPVNDFEPLYLSHLDAMCSTNVFDYKSGDPHDYEFQMYGYAMSLLQKNPAWESVTVHLLYGQVRSGVRFIVKRGFADPQILAVIDRHASPDRKPTACDFCKWCIHAPICPELNGVALAVAGNREDWKLENYHASEIVKPEEMAKALRMARFLTAWCEGVEHHAKELAIKGGCIIPGFKLNSRGGKRFVSDIGKAFDILCSKEPPETVEKALSHAREFLTCCSVQIGELETKLGKKKLTEILGPVISRGLPSYSLATEKSYDVKEIAEPAPVAAAEDTDF